MSKAPEHYRPYNHEHAQAGAPIGTKIGGKATIFHISKDRIIGMVSGEFSEHAAEWTFDGRKQGNDRNQGVHDLVMLPLGMCEGKPVFVGDVLENYAGTKVAAFVDMVFTPDAAWHWPRPETEYPKTRMTNTDYARVLNCGDKFNLLGCENIANAAIIHAIKSGDVVPAEALHILAMNLINSFSAGVKWRIDNQGFDPDSGAKIDVMMKHWGINIEIKKLKEKYRG